MPALRILRGATEGTIVPLDGEKFILGRNPDCAVVIPITSVSREHAQIVRVQGKYFIEDKGSRNGTFVNNQAITGKTQLKNNDQIRICDFMAAFLEPYPQPSPTPTVEAEDDEEPADEGDGSSTVEATLSSSSHQLLDSQPAEKLRGLLEISANLSKTLELDPLLPKIVDSLFQLFRAADRCFLIQAEEGGRDNQQRLIPRVVKTRRPTEETTARFSRSIVRKCLESASAFLSDDASRDDRIQLSQSVVDFRIRSVMCVPLCGADGRAFGVIQLDTQDRSKKFNQEDLKFLCGVANQAAIAIENARLHGEVVKRERLKRDLELAHTVQLSFLPRSAPQVAGYEFHHHYQAASEVGGDYYGYIPLSEGRIAVAVGDVAGKGVAAALMMAKLSSETRLSLLTDPDSAKAVSKLNDLLYPFTSQADRFVTFAVCVLDPAKHTVTMVSAGHPSPMLYRPSSPALTDVVPRKTAGLALGIMEGYPFESCQIALQPGDTLLIYTDGATDMLDVKGTQFDVKGIKAAVQGAGNATPQGLVDRIAKAVTTHATGREPFDDITLVSFGRRA